jgi:hypothetical protein
MQLEAAFLLGPEGTVRAVEGDRVREMLGVHVVLHAAQSYRLVATPEALVIPEPPNLLSSPVVRLRYVPD